MQNITLETIVRLYFKDASAYRIDGNAVYVAPRNVQYIRAKLDSAGLIDATVHPDPALNQPKG